MSASKLGLNERQWQAIRHRDGPLLVLAGPGSGKTTVITCRIHYLIVKHKVLPHKILVVTFSKAAAVQMERRFLSLAETPGVTFGTFHAIFFKILREHKGYTIDQVLRDDERKSIIKRMINEIQSDEITRDDEFIASVINEMSLVKNELFELKRYNSKHMGSDQFKKLYEDFENFKNDNNKIDFDDMLLLCYKLFKENPSCLAKWRNKFEYLMIDEFQDINNVQYECIKMLTEPHENLFVVGDDDQAIYRFRGSRPEFLQSFQNDFKRAGKVILDINYRSTDEIINLGNKIILNNRVRLSKVINGTNKKGVPPKIITPADHSTEAADISALIIKMINSGFDPDEIAVIYRLNVQGRALAEAFMLRNIPYRLKDEMPIIYEHWVAKDIVSYLKASKIGSSGFNTEADKIINKPQRFIGQAFLTDAREKNADIFKTYARSPYLQVQQKTRIEELGNDFKSISKLKPHQAIKYIRQIVGYDDYIKDFCIYKNLSPSGLYEISDELQESAKPFLTAEEFFLHAEEATAAAKNNSKAMYGKKAVSLTTMHSAKGLEYEAVFVAGVIKDIIPHERSKTEAEIEEERRLFYVSVTRAKKILYISVPKKKYERPVEPSKFITELKKKKEVI
ncbi:MAG: ATP-dependent helicase [Defluviitaleaceae bacterium]|nr:ATP-dependent helicase [Defluviitaleaceae bacterium]